MALHFSHKHPSKASGSLADLRPRNLLLLYPATKLAEIALALLSARFVLHQHGRCVVWRMRQDGGFRHPHPPTPLYAAHVVANENRQMKTDALHAAAGFHLSAY